METFDLVATFLKNHADDYNFFVSLVKTTPADKLWERALGQNSLANLLCHVAEMEKFWIDQGLFGEPYDRNRQIEFDREGDLTADELAARLEERKDLTQKKVAGVKQENLNHVRNHHGDEISGAGILMWHARHLGLHRGQAVMLARYWENHT